MEHSRLPGIGEKKKTLVLTSLSLYYGPPRINIFQNLACVNGVLSYGHLVFYILCPEVESLSELCITRWSPLYWPLLDVGEDDGFSFCPSLLYLCKCSVSHLKAKKQVSLMSSGDGRWKLHIKTLCAMLTKSGMIWTCSLTYFCQKSDSVRSPPALENL